MDKTNETTISDVVLEEMNKALLSGFLERERLKKQIEKATDALETISATPLNSRVIHDVAEKAIKEISDIADYEQPVHDIEQKE